ncbi:MAG: hypothetical protein OEZ43_21580 [Gammaproteobacteria bacterium]|nr:hypothetical protein [Gammaproteobacteria bacterium]
MKQPHTSDALNLEASKSEIDTLMAPLGADFSVVGLFYRSGSRFDTQVLMADTGDQTGICGL